MRVHPFAMLAAAPGPGAVELTPLPILVDRDGEVVTLRGHVARANPMARLIADSTPQAPLHATAVFAGPQAYVSPDWYETENQVPTWNYLAVHASGALEHVADPVAFEALLADLSAVNAAALAPKRPWTMGQMADRMCVVQGQGVSVRVYHGGRWSITRKPANKHCLITHILSH